ncbi:MAG: formylglycine-generating enzyme family protein, partial [Spirochaetota bacterium]|nr:formylglycine-generating enzyme family protein [Spirochaetota bacterium]
RIGGIDFIYIKGGEFWMGSPERVGGDREHPRHKVQMSGFWIGKYEITQGEYEALMGKNPSKYRGDARRPVDSVSWNDAKKFCAKFGSKYGIIARLPTEAEWEYAARAGTTTNYYWGDTVHGNYCWYYDNSGDTTQPVGQKRPNAWGLYDMSGNVWEWCEDWYAEDYYSKSPARDPKGPSSGNYHVLRGGSWHKSVNQLRSAYRFWDHADDRDFNDGFRVVLSTPKQ